MQRRRVQTALLAATMMLPLLWPLWTGRVLFLRDIGTTHRPAWDAYSKIGLAAINPAASFGQPYRGNPNLLILYPFPKSARSLEWHVVVHVLWMAAGVGWWLSSRVRPLSAIVGAMTFCLSGAVVSCLTMLNSLTTVAWLPWVLACASAPLRRTASTIACVLVVGIFTIAGEPVLIAPGLLLALALAWRNGTFLRFLLTVTLGLLLTLPVHWETFAMARESSRVARGYTFEQAMAYTLHPARLLESLLPGIFGSPAFLTAGAWWGYGVSGDAAPYFFSVAFGVIPMALSLAYAVSGGLRDHRGWWAVLFLALLISMARYLPGFRAVWEALPPLHVVRFPIKALLFATVAAAVLTAYAFEALAERKKTASAAAALFGLTSLLAFGAALQHRRILATLIATWWNPRWRSDAPLVLEPIAAAIAPRLLGVALMLLLLMIWASKPQRRSIAWLVLGFMVVDMTLAARHVVPTMHRDYARHSPLAKTARTIPGRVFERVARDLDTVRNGTIGNYPSNDASWLAVAQHCQVWSLHGAMEGVRYAYDRSPDGSYSWRNQLVQGYLEYTTWRERVKWLRAVGVGSVLAADIVEPIPGLGLVMRDDAVGIPATLYAIESPLRELRGPEVIHWVRTPEEAILAMRRPDFDETREMIMEDPARRAPSEQGEILVIERLHEADRVSFHTKASRPGYVFLARSYTREVRAFTGDTPLRVVPAMAHLCGIEVPAGEQEIVITF